MGLKRKAQQPSPAPSLEPAVGTAGRDNCGQVAVRDTGEARFFTAARAPRPIKRRRAVSGSGTALAIVTRPKLEALPSSFWKADADLAGEHQVQHASGSRTQVVS